MTSSSSPPQMIDRICVKVQDHLNSLRNSETDAILEDVRAAENLIKDARNSKTVGSETTRHSTSGRRFEFEPLFPLPVSLQLLPNLYHLGAAAREEVSCSSVRPIQEKLESMAGEVTTVMDQQLQVKK